MMNLVQPGDLVIVDHRASVQFRPRPIWFRVIRVLPHITYDGWVWLDGYEIDKTSGDATSRREIFVQEAGLRHISRSPTGRSRNAGPAQRRAADPHRSRSERV
jgi:hypothetical protein